MCSPHAYIYGAGRLADFVQCPSTGLWILEIQIAHPVLPYGAFYEDILFDADAMEAEHRSRIRRMSATLHAAITPL